MKCPMCGSDATVETKLMGSVTGTVAFHFEPKKGRIIKRGVPAEASFCDDCGYVMFFISSENRKKIFRNS